MIFVEAKEVKLGGVVLPGNLKSIEIISAAAIDEANVQGSAVKPKQAVGYEDAKIKVALIVGSTASETAESKLAKIYALFRKKGQGIPQAMNIVSKQTAAANISKVIFQQVTAKKENKSDLYAVTLDFCEYIPMPIQVAPAGSSTSGNANLSASYQAYLGVDRGTAPRLGDKTVYGPTADDRVPPKTVSFDSLRR